MVAIEKILFAALGMTAVHAAGINVSCDDKTSQFITYLGSNSHLFYYPEPMSEQPVPHLERQMLPRDFYGRERCNVLLRHRSQQAD